MRWQDMLEGFTGAVISVEPHNVSKKKKTRGHSHGYPNYKQNISKLNSTTYSKYTS